MLTLMILPLHRDAYHIDMESMTPLLVLMLHEISSASCSGPPRG